MRLYDAAILQFDGSIIFSSPSVLYLFDIQNVGYSFLTWTVIYLCVAWGLKTTGRITYFTMGFPVILLFVFLGKSVSLEGAQDGIDEYLNSNWDALTETPQVWALATSQIFFSLSVTFGIMTAYGSHCHRNEPAFCNSW